MLSSTFVRFGLFFSMCTPIMLTVVNVFFLYLKRLHDDRVMFCFCDYGEVWTALYLGRAVLHKVFLERS